MEPIVTWNEVVMDFEKSKARCDLKWGSDGYLKKVDKQRRQRTTSDCKIEIVARFDTDYFFIESFRKQ